MQFTTGLQGSAARPPVPATATLKGAEEMKADYERRQRERQRDETLAGCPRELVTFAAGASALAYHPPETIRRALEPHGARDVAPFDCRGTQAVAFCRDNVRWLVFRGTESQPEIEFFRDWGHDICVGPWGLPPRHVGFAHAWSLIRDEVLTWIAATSGAGRLVLSGHSLGGALAVMAADDIADRKLAEIEAVLTFGAPRVGTWPWAARHHERVAQRSEDGKMTKSLRDVSWRIHNDRDIVTHVPFLIFKHCGTPISATRLQQFVTQPFVTLPALHASPVLPRRADEPALSRLKRAYRDKKGPMPVTPITLLIDLALSMAESAPEHFMRHYGAAFPDRPFGDLGDPVRAPASGFINGSLKTLRYAIFAGGISLLGWVMWKAYWMSPELTLLALTFAAINIIIEFAYD